MKCIAGYWWKDKWHKLETEFCNSNGRVFQYCYAECLLSTTFNIVMQGACCPPHSILLCRVPVVHHIQYCYAECLLFITFTGWWKYLWSVRNVIVQFFPLLSLLVSSTHLNVQFWLLLLSFFCSIMVTELNTAQRHLLCISYISIQLLQHQVK